MRTGRRKATIAAVMLTAVWAGQVYGDFILGAPTKVANINGGTTTLGGSISADGLSLYFSSERSGGYGGTFDMYVATRPSMQDSWGPVANLGPTLNGATWEYAVNVSPDRLTLLFSSDRPGGSGGMDLWMATRPTIDSPWSTPVNLGPTVNSSAWDLSPKISADGLTLLFHSNRSGGLGGEDIWMAGRASEGNPWGTPLRLAAPVNSSANDGEPVLSADGLTLFFNSDRAGGSGNYDLWVTRRRSTNAAWGTPVNLGPTVNSPAVEWCGSLSPDGSTLYFTSDRPTAWGPCSIYQAKIVPMADFNGDGKVDEADAHIMTANLGANDSLCDIAPAPFGDGVVDMNDVAVLTQCVSGGFQDPTMVACWKLDETEGLIAADSASVFDGLLVGGPVWQPQAGAVDGALQFDGVDDCVVTQSACDPSRQPLSILAWVKGGAPGQVILSQRLCANWLAAGAPKGALTTELKGNDRFSKTLVSSTIITDGDWHHVGLVLDSTGRTLYIDGEVVARDSQNRIPNAYGDLYIGSGKDRAAGSFWSGLIDDIRIYNRTVKP